MDLTIVDSRPNAAIFAIPLGGRRPRRCERGDLGGRLTTAGLCAEALRRRPDATIGRGRR
jgi:hypothetical protein